MAKTAIVLLLGVLIVEVSTMPENVNSNTLLIKRARGSTRFEERSRVARQTLGYQPIESTDIVISSAGSQTYRGVPSTRGQTVVVRVPNENGRRYLANPYRETQMNHFGLPY